MKSQLLPVKLDPPHSLPRSSHFSLMAPIETRSPDAVNLATGSPTKSTSWAVFGSTFLTIFLAELGDKTQLSTLLLSAQSQSPWIVFLGSAAALIATSLLGVLIGRWLANRLAPRTVETAAGVSLLLISVMLCWDVLQFRS